MITRCKQRVESRSAGVARSAGVPARCERRQARVGFTCLGVNIDWRVPSAVECKSTNCRRRIKFCSQPIDVVLRPSGRGRPRYDAVKSRWQLGDVVMRPSGRGRPRYVAGTPAVRRDQVPLAINRYGIATKRAGTPALL